jgi:hypothetical protein
MSHAFHLELVENRKNSTWIMDVILMNVAPSSGRKSKSIIKPSELETRACLRLLLSQQQQDMSRQYH